MLYAIVCALIIVLFVAELFYLITLIQRVISVHILHKVPIVSSTRCLRRAVVRAINQHYPDARTAYEIGSGYGGLARKMARRCGLNVTALEYMPVCAWVSHMLDRITFANSKTVRCDAFKYLETAKHVDIAVSYMGPADNDLIIKMHNRFDVLILVDVPVKHTKPTRVIDIGYGGTKIGTTYYPHKLYVYEFSHK